MMEVDLVPDHSDEMADRHNPETEVDPHTHHAGFAGTVVVHTPVCRRVMLGTSRRYAAMEKDSWAASSAKVDHNSIGQNGEAERSSIAMIVEEAHSSIAEVDTTEMLVVWVDWRKTQEVGMEGNSMVVDERTVIEQVVAHGDRLKEVAACSSFGMRDIGSLEEGCKAAVMVLMVLFLISLDRRATAA